MKKNQTFCLQCGLPLVGRADKKYCDDGCRNTYHNARMMDANKICRPYHRSLKQNYGVLSEHLQAGTEVVHKDELLMEGFDPKALDELLALEEKGLHSVLICTIGKRAENDRYQHLKKVRRPIKSLFTTR